MRFELCVKCLFQNVSLFRLMIHLLAILPFCEMFHFTCFAKIRDGKQMKHFQNRHFFSMFRCFATLKSAILPKTLLVTMKSTAVSLFCYLFVKSSVFWCFGEHFVICFSESFSKTFCQTDAKQAKKFR
jgi:hypothetical protein